MVVRRLGRVLWWGVAAVIVGLAVALSIARLLLPGMSQYRAQVEDLVEHAVHRQVDIGAMQAAWYRFSPVLRLQNVVIHDESFPGGKLDVGEIQVGLDVIESLSRRKWLTSGIRVTGVELALKTDLSARPRDAVNMEPFYWLMRQKRLSLQDVTLDWQDPGLFEQAVKFTGLSAQLKSDGWRHQLFVQTDINDTYGERIAFAADLSGPLKLPKSWRGMVYLKTGKLHLPAVQKLAGLKDYATEGDVDLEVWARVSKSEVKWSAGTIRLAQPRISRLDESGASFAVDTLSSHFSLGTVDRGWSLELHKFSLFRDQLEVWPETSVRAVIRKGESLSVEGRISHIEVAEAGKLIPLLPWVDRSLQHRVGHLKPLGELTGTEFELLLSDDAPPGLSLRSRFDKLGMSADEGLPGATGLSGRIDGNLNNGVISFDTEQAGLQMPKVFSGEIDVSSLSGDLQWQRLSDRLRLSSDRLQLVSGSLNAHTRLQLDWLPDRSAPWIDMQLWADELPMVDVKHFLPDQAMRPKPLKWLRNAFQRGSARELRFLLQGPLDRMPFDHGEGRMEARFDFDDVLLDYHPLWGELDVLRGSARFVNRSMRITGTSATILDAGVDRAVAVIDDFAQPVLDIDGTVSGTLESLLAYINHSPLDKRFGKLVEQVTTRGDADLKLGLRIPLRPELGKLQVAGSVGFQDNSLQAAGSSFTLEDVNGSLEFTGHGVTAQGISARLLEHPVKVSVYPEGSEETQRTVVDIEGDLELVKMLEKEHANVAPYIDGATYWHVLLQVPSGKEVSGRPVTVQLRSDLEGVAIHLPAPFGKIDKEVFPVSISWVPGKISSEPLVMKLGDEIALQLLVSETDGKLRKAALHFGEGDASLPASDSVHLSGGLDMLSLDAWIDQLRDIAKRDSDSAMPVLPISTDLDLRQVSLLGYLAQGLNVSSRADEPWNFTIDGRDMAGQASWTPAMEGAVPMLALHLDRLTAVQTQETVQAESEVVLTPERLPDLDLEIGKLQLGPYALGKVIVRGERVEEGVLFPDLRVEARAIAFDGEGAWLQQGEQQSTRFRADIIGGELGRLVKMFGDSGSIKGAQMRGHISFDWPGNPADFSLATVEGTLSLETGKGRLVEIKEGAGKLLNLLNLNSLQRRLTLDFTDLTKEGFSFDKMEGSLVIGDGNAYTDDFVLHGTSATIEISGRTGLADRDYDQLIKVTPQVSSSLPLAGVIAGGPAVGAAVFLAERLVGKEFNRMAQVRYKVSGSWDKPVYTRLKPETEPEQPGEADSP